MASARPLQVKNRAPAPIQITAEQLIRESRDKQFDGPTRRSSQLHIADHEELQQYRQGKRKDFENQIRRQRHLIGVWCKYALWEASQKEFVRSRSVFERALDVDYRNNEIWFKYAEMEMKNKFINHARNIWDRAVALLPRVDQFWYKYSYMEEMVGAIDEARQVFERWMKWQPDDMGWAAYIKFEMRQGEIERARGVYERYIEALPSSRSYLKYARWEEHNGDKERCRGIFERALGGELAPEEHKRALLVGFAKFEERCKEYDRARVIYQYAIDQSTINGDAKEIDELKTEFINYEKRHGSREGIEDIILNNRRAHYEDQLKDDCYAYDTWFDLIRLEESEVISYRATSSSFSVISKAINRCREVYERAVENIPPIQEKRYWRRYIYLWLSYAIFEELHGGEIPLSYLQAEQEGEEQGEGVGNKSKVVNGIKRAREVYQECLKVIPHKVFTFGKIWLEAAYLEVRDKDLTAARKLLGRAIGLCPKEKLFKGYIELELQLGEIERCRQIYAKYLEFMPFNCTAWKAYSQLEINVGETQRARGIFDIAISESDLDMPEVLWKAYIDFEISEGESENVRSLYSRLLERTNHVKVWISFAQFEASEIGGGLPAARKIFQDGYDSLKTEGLKEERVVLLEAWKAVESEATKRGEEGDVDLVIRKLPRKIKMRRMVTDDSGAAPGGGKDEIEWEEYYDYHFPDDEKKIAGIKILENALKWKQMMAAGATAGTSSTASASAGQEQGSAAEDNGSFSSGSTEPSGELGKRKERTSEEDEEEQEGKGARGSSDVGEVE